MRGSALGAGGFEELAELSVVHAVSAVEFGDVVVEAGGTNSRSGVARFEMEREGNGRSRG